MAMTIAPARIYIITPGEGLRGLRRYTTIQEAFDAADTLRKLRIPYTLRIWEEGRYPWWGGMEDYMYQQLANPTSQVVAVAGEPRSGGR